MPLYQIVRMPQDAIHSKGPSNAGNISTAQCRWWYIVVDEGHRLKNATCCLSTKLRTFKAEGRLLLTGNVLHLDAFTRRMHVARSIRSILSMQNKRML